MNIPIKYKKSSTNTLTLTHSFSHRHFLSFSHTHTLSLSLSHTHIHSLSHAHNLSFTLSVSISLTQQSHTCIALTIPTTLNTSPGIQRLTKSPLTYNNQIRVSASISILGCISGNHDKRKQC